MQALIMMACGSKKIDRVFVCTENISEEEFGKLCKIANEGGCVLQLHTVVLCPTIDDLIEGIIT